MDMITTAANRRRDERVDWDDTIRWKRSGRIEDHKAWASDRSPTSLGFLTTTDSAPAVGDELHVRRMDYDRWAILDEVVRVARVSKIASDNLSVVGCTLGWATDDDIPVSPTAETAVPQGGPVTTVLL